MSAAVQGTRGAGSSAHPGAAGGRPGAGAGIRITDLHLAFRGPTTTLDVLDGVSFEVAPREVLALIGPNGSGKSTLLRVAAGLLRPDRGQVTIDGQPVDGPDSRLALVFQEPRLLPWRSAEENVRFPMELAGWPPARQAARAAELLGMVGLRDFAATRPAHLSGGMRQRLAIARALALEPSVLLLDEPFSALDALTRERFNVELLRLWERTGTTIVLVTHSITEAVFVADRVAVLSPRPGHIVGIVPVELPRPRSPAQLDSAIVSRAAAAIRAQLVDTTDDQITLREAMAPSGPGSGAAWIRETAAEAGTAAWFDPFGHEAD